jgi:galactitol-specific phosphotransferase system IIB component
MIILKFNNKIIKEKVIEVLKSNKFDMDVTDILTNLEENLSKTEYKLNDEELYLYKQLLTEISRVLPKNYYYITYRGFNNWFVITDLSNDEELCRANLNAISVFEYNKYKNDADIYICVKHKPDNSLSGRDEWRSKCGMD